MPGCSMHSRPKLAERTRYNNPTQNIVNNNNKNNCLLLFTSIEFSCIDCKVCIGIFGVLQETVTVFLEKSGSRDAAFAEYFRRNRVFVEYTCFLTRKSLQDNRCLGKKWLSNKNANLALVYNFCREFANAMEPR